MTTLTELNALRTAAGMKPLKAWKESKAKLDAAVAKLQETMPALTRAMTTDAKPAGKKVVVKKTAAKKATGEGVKVSTIAEELGIDPKVARAKLRRHFGDTPKSGGGQWVFTKDKVAEIKAILKGDARKKD
jgi:hypothetical protein